MRIVDVTNSYQRRLVWATGTQLTTHNATVKSVVRSDIKPSDGIRATAYSATVTEAVPSLGSFKYTREIYTTVNGVWQWKQVIESPPRSHDGYIAGAPAATLTENPQSLRGEASSKLRVALKDQKINLAVVYAFRKETASTIVDLSNRLVLAGRAFRKKDPALLGLALRGRRGVKENSGAAADWWLAYWFGVMPIIDDLNGLLGTIAESPEPRLFKVSGHAKETIAKATVKNPVAAPNFTDSSGEGYYYWREYTTSGYISCRAHATLRIDTEGIRDMARKGILNPAVVAYDLAKWSFILGWVVSIGEFLQGLDAGAGVSVVTGCFSEQKVTRQISTRGSYTRTYTAGGVKWRCKSVGSAVGSYSKKEFVRTPFTELPSASVYLKNPLNGWIAVTAMALIRSAVNEKGNWERKPPALHYKQPRRKYLPSIKYTRP